MASETLAVLPASDFHTFTEQILTSVDYALLGQLRAKLQPEFHECAFEDEYCVCRERGTVHHLELEQDFCARHFQAVMRG